MASTIDREVRRLIHDAHDRAEAILTAYRTTLDSLASEMLDKETLDEAELERIFDDVDTWVDPDPSALDADVVEPADDERVGGDAPAVVASERTDADPGDAAPASTPRRARRWLRLRPGPSST